MPRQRSHATVLGQASARIRADAAARGMNRTVLMAHAWVAAGGTDDERRDAATRQQSSSERDISVGGIGYVPAALFDGFSYVALGHLHGQQTLAEHLRYSGSPLPYSFSEKNHKKGSWLVEVGIDGKTRVERVAAPVYRRLAELAGRIDDLLTSAEYDGHEDDFVAVTLTDAARPGGGDGPAPPPVPAHPHARVQARGGDRDQRSYRERVKGRDDLTVAAEFVRHVRNTEATEFEHELLADAFTAAAGTRRRHPRGRPLMRPHRLRVQAFGAFAGTEEVTFDDLEGLFLLHGETGAGKTTLLDAIAFALYGRVPGERGSARRLRSDHAAAGLTTEVELEATIGGRQLRITRKPEQDRPKKSGVGVTREQAAVRLDERTAAGRLGEQVRPRGRGGPGDQGSHGHVGRAVLPGRAPPAGPVRPLPARQRAGQGGAAAEAVQHRPVPRGRALAGRPPPGDREGSGGQDRGTSACSRPRSPRRPTSPSPTRRRTRATTRPSGWPGWRRTPRPRSEQAAAQAAELSAELERALAAKSEAEQLAGRQRRRRDALGRQRELQDAAPVIAALRAEADAAAAGRPGEGGP